MLAHLILAAGSSSRLGTEKQLLRWNHKSLIQHAVAESLKLKTVKTFVVLGFNAAIIRKEIKDQDVVIIENQNWDRGIGSSISYGIENISKNANFDGVLISLVDQPLLDYHYLQKMIICFRKDLTRPVATKYKLKLGVPAVFPTSYIQKLIGLQGDEGAKRVLNTADLVETIEADGLHMDIDTMEDYEKVKNVKGNSNN